MKTVFLNRFFFPDHSATSQMLTDLAFDLREQGRDVRVITSRQRYDDPGAALRAEETAHGVQVSRVWSTRFGRAGLGGRAVDYLSYHVTAARCLMRLVSPGDVVVAKTDPPLISVVAGAVARRRGAVLVNWLQDLFPEVASALKVAGTRGRMLRSVQRRRDASLRIARMNVVVGEGMAERVRALGVAPERVRVIHNWADSRLLRPVAAADNLLRGRWGFDGKFVVGYSGNMGRSHEFETLLAAASRLRERGDIAFVFIGDGSQRLRLEGSVRAQRLGNVQFQPYQPRDRLSESLSVPDVHVVSLLPELEGLVVPSKFYGVAAAARPTIFVGDAQGEIPRLLRAADCGVVVPPGRGEMLAERIVALATDPAGAGQMGRNARRLLEERFDRRRAAEQWREVLQEAQGSAAESGR